MHLGDAVLSDRITWRAMLNAYTTGEIKVVRSSRETSSVGRWRINACETVTSSESDYIRGCSHVYTDAFNPVSQISRSFPPHEEVIRRVGRRLECFDSIFTQSSNRQINFPCFLVLFTSSLRCSCKDIVIVDPFLAVITYLLIAVTL